MEESVERRGGLQTGAEETAGGRRERRRQQKLMILLVLLSLFLLVVCLASYYLTTRKPLPSLPPVQAITRGIPPQFLFSIFGVSGPMGVAVSPNGQIIYVMEGGGERQIKAFDRSGRQLASFSPPDSRPATRNPIYGATDRQGRLYVTDRARMAILVFTPEGKFIENFAAEGREMSWMPLGITFDPVGNLFVTEVTEGKHRVMAFDPYGKQILEFGKEGRGPGEFSFPNALVVDRKGRIFVSNSNNGRIDVFDSSGKLVASFGSGSGVGTVGLPRGMGIDDVDRLYVADTVSHLVNVYDLTSDQFKFLFTFGKEGMGDGEFNFPNGLAVDPTGRIYVTDRANDRVQVWGY